MTAPTTTRMVGEILSMDSTCDTPCERAESHTRIPSDNHCWPSMELGTTRDNERTSPPVSLTVQSIGRTAISLVDSHGDKEGADREQWMLAGERGGMDDQHSKVSLSSSTLSVRENLRSVLAEKDSELERLKLMYQKALSARDRQIRSLQADLDSLGSQLSDRMRQVQVVQEANQLKDQHIELLKNIVDDLQTKITSPKHSMFASREMVEDLKSQIKERDEQLAAAKSEVAGLRKQAAVTLSPTKAVERMAQASKQEVGIRTVSQQAVDMTDVSEEFSPLSPTQSLRQEQIFADSQRSKPGTDGLRTRLDASVQTIPDSTHESMSKAVVQLERLKGILSMKEGALKQSMDLADRLSRELKSQRSCCVQQERVIDHLKAEMRSKTTELLDHSIQRLQAVISEKDSLMALLEMQGAASLKNRSCIHALKQEKNKLMKELKDKMQQKIELLQNVAEEDGVEHCGMSGCSSQEYSLEQVCEAIRVLEQSKSRLRGYIDQLVALVLDRNPSLLEGLPRIQQNMGMSPDLLRVASLPELLLELREDEEDICCLQNYTALLLQKISDYSPDLLNCMDELCLPS